METAALLYDLNTSYGLELPETVTMDALETLLAERINVMINKDFSELVQLLYRIDVDESRLRLVLRDNQGSDSGLLIARLILERQWQKILTRRAYGRKT
jgi:hypothetical protein